MRRGALTIELVGLPGAGKSTLSHSVAALLRARGLSVQETTWELDHRVRRPGRVARKLAHIAREIATHPADALRSCRAVRSTRQRNVLLLVKVLYNWFLICGLLRLRPAGIQLHLLDQGIAQALWSVGLDADEGALRRFDDAVLRALPLPDLIVLVDVTGEAARRRLAERGGHSSRADRWADLAGDDAAAWKRASALLDDVRATFARLAASRGGPRLLVAQNDDDAALTPCTIRLADAFGAALTGRSA